MENSGGQARCPFKATIMTQQFGCEHAESITRREGPDIACGSSSANGGCVTLFENLKQSALPDMGYNDDLLSMPASVLQKIQFGGLLALQELVTGSKQEERVENIIELVKQATEKYGEVGAIPVQLCNQRISDYKLKKRRR